jgi:hypothetical protein
MANLHKIWEKTSERDCDQHANEEERNILCNISNTQQTTKGNKMRFTSQVTSTREKCQSIWATAAFQLNRKWSSAQRSTFNCCSADNAERYMMNLTPNGQSLTQCNIYQHTLLGRWGVQFIRMRRWCLTPKNSARSGEAQDFNPQELPNSIEQGEPWPQHILLMNRWEISDKPETKVWHLCQCQKTVVTHWGSEWQGQHCW